MLAKLRRKEITLFRAAEFLNVTVHTLATYLSTLQGPDRISLGADINVPATMSLDGNSELDNNDAINEMLQKINASNNASAPSGTVTPTTSTPIKRETGGYLDLPGLVVGKAPSSVLENNPDITIVKTESMQRKRDFTKVCYLLFFFFVKNKEKNKVLTYRFLRCRCQTRRTTMQS